MGEQWLNKRLMGSWELSAQGPSKSGTGSKNIIPIGVVWGSLNSQETFGVWGALQEEGRD